jgi:hypothetical protein
MVFIKRDAKNKICALLDKAHAENAEELEPDDPEILLFLSDCITNNKSDFLKSDLAFIRVLEDLIQILMEKNIISITDFPEPAIEKLVDRNKIRKLFRDIGGLIDKD